MTAVKCVCIWLVCLSLNVVRSRWRWNVDTGYVGMESVQGWEQNVKNVHRWDGDKAYGYGWDGNQRAGF